MRAELAILFIQERMREMKFKEHEIHLRHFVLDESEELTIDGGSDVWVLCDENLYIKGTGGNQPAFSIRIESENGVYDLDDTTIKELEHEHTGKIKLKNKTRSSSSPLNLS